MKDTTVGFAMCGSYCTFDSAITALERVCTEYKTVIPILSENAYSTDTRFGSVASFIDRIESLCNREIIHTITECEPIGPRALLDILIIAPCTGNTLAKLSHGVTDTSVTMAAKAHMRNNRPLLIALSTNDALSGNAGNIGSMMSRKNVFFVPFYQDDPINKPTSLIADLTLLSDAIDAALNSRQLQPVLAAPPQV